MSTHLNWSDIAIATGKLRLSEIWFVIEIVIFSYYNYVYLDTYYSVAKPFRLADQS